MFICVKVIIQAFFNMAKKVKSLKRPWVVERKPFERENSNSKFYNSRTWRNFRKVFLENNPLCVACKENGFIVVANVVDHILPINKGGDSLSESNLQSLCSRCHNRKSAKDK